MTDKFTQVRVKVETLDKLRELAKIYYSTPPKIIDLIADKLIADARIKQVTQNANQQ